MFQSLRLISAFFCSVQENGSLSRMTRFPFFVSYAEQWNAFVFLISLNLIFNFQKSRISFCYGVLYIVSVFLTS